jgi:NAD(P)-dependent dehydrogenase (short-subunit alcohol dehydrogenase family)
VFDASNQSLYLLVNNHFVRASATGAAASVGSLTRTTRSASRPGPRASRSLGLVDPKVMDWSIKPLIRYGEPGEIADVVAFLAGPRSRYISSQILRVDASETLPSR